VSDHTDGKNCARNWTEKSVQYLNLNNDSVESIMNSQYFSTVRLQLLSGVKPEACLRCYAEEEKGVRSKRVEENERLGFTEDMARTITNADGSIPVNFKFVELRLGNLCNVKCRTCNPTSSTSWSSEYQKLQSEIKFVTHYDKSINSNWTESDEFWDDLLEHSADLQLLYVNGGEPTLVEKHWRYLEKLIDRGLNKQITLWYNINMTNLPDKLIELWKQFKEVQVTCSIDDLGERNEYIRTGTKWETVEKNLDKLQSLPWIKLGVCQTIGWMNVYYLPEFHKYMKKRGIHVHLNFVYDPKFLSVQTLPADLASKVLCRCKDLEPWKLNALQGQIVTNDSSALLSGIKYNRWLDDSRNTSFAETFAEWNNIIEKYLND
jgi:organic radical activating enzyme